jgi:hypothetical protein
MSDASPTIIQHLSRFAFPMHSEKETQAEIAKALTKGGFVFEREKRLSAEDIPDFLVKDGIVIEVKLRTGISKMNIYRQLERYSRHETVKEIILVSNITMGLPPEINGKPAYFLSLGRAWL